MGGIEPKTIWELHIFLIDVYAETAKMPLKVNGAFTVYGKRRRYFFGGFIFFFDV